MEDFRPTSGSTLGNIGLGFSALVALYALVADPGRASLTLALGLAFLGLAVWAALVRPRARAEASTLVLRNVLSDFRVPLASVDDVNLRQTLNVYVGEERYTCVGLGRSTRSLLRGGSGTYEDYVVDRIGQLASAARQRGDPPGPVQHVWAWPVVAGLVLTGVAFVANLLV